LYCDALASTPFVRRGKSTLKSLVAALCRSAGSLKDFATSFPKTLLSLLACWSLHLISKVGFFGTGGAGLRAILDDLEAVNA